MSTFNDNFKAEDISLQFSAKNISPILYSKFYFLPFSFLIFSSTVPLRPMLTHLNLTSFYAFISYAVSLVTFVKKLPLPLLRILNSKRLQL